MDYKFAVHKMAIVDGDMLPASDFSDYPAMVKSWRNPAIAIPSDIDLIAAFNLHYPPLARAEALRETMDQTEAPGNIARKVEDILDFLQNGTALPAKTKAWAADRKARRGAL